MRRSPSHLCPLGCVLTSALGPRDTTPNRLRRERGRSGTRQGQGHCSVNGRKQTNDIRQARWLYGLLTQRVILGEDLQRADMIKTLFGADGTPVVMLAYSKKRV